MLIFLADYLVQFYSVFNIFFYVTFRSIISLLTALFISLWIGPNLISFLQKLQIDQIIRNDGPKSHFNKYGTPTMGGLIFIISIFFSVLTWTYIFNPYVWYVLFILISYGAIGFIDDYLKIKHKNSRGLPIYLKYFWQSLIAFIISYIMFINNKDVQATQLVIPFFKDVMPQLGLWYILLSYFVIVGTSNAVNLTDGLDGLAIMPAIFIAAALAIIAWTSSNINIANYLNIPYLYFAGELAVVCTAIIGAGLGFLWFNTYPAQIFMGDVGSLSLGGTIGGIAVLLRQELLLFIMGGVFVIETLSVILQIISFKLFGKKIFLMAPIHHHYELKGYPEPRLIVRFWIISLILVLISLMTLKLR